MDRHHHNTKAQFLTTTHNPRQQQTEAQNQTVNQTLEQDFDMPAHPPPSYHTVVDPTAPIPNLHSPYDPQDDADYEKDAAEDIPEVTINATTQIRGHANIITVPPMDAVRIAGLLHTMMFGPPGATNTANANGANANGGTGNANAHLHQRAPRINITVNCGATVVGDRNVVGLALGDLARQVQIARQVQANAAAAQQAQQAQQAHAQAQAQAAQQTQQAQAQARARAAQAMQAKSVPAMHVPMVSGPVPVSVLNSHCHTMMSRSGEHMHMHRRTSGSESESEGSVASSACSSVGSKRKAEGEVEGSERMVFKRRDSDADCS